MRLKHPRSGTYATLDIAASSHFAGTVHELSVASSALQAALQAMQAAGGTRIERIILRVGDISGVDPEALRFAFSAILPDTAAEGADLEILPVPVRVHCADCQTDFCPGATLDFTCPACRRISTAVTEGRELELTRLEIL